MVMTSAIKKSVLPLIVNRAIKKSWRKKKLPVMILQVRKWR